MSFAMNQEPRHELIDRLAETLDFRPTSPNLRGSTETARRKARQMLGAMFHLPDDMLAAGQRVREEGGSVRDVWQAMLDEALKGSTI
jgi:hypothetical protein